MANVHIYPSPFTHESRILKEAETLKAHLAFGPIFLVGVAAPGLPRRQAVSDGIEIWRLGPAKGQGLMKIVCHLLWCANVLSFCLRMRARIINSHSLPVLPIGVLLKWLTGAKLVYDAHELETETNGLSGVRQKLSRIVERVCIRFVDLLIVVSPGIERWYRSTYGNLPAITILNTPLYREACRTSLLSERLGIRPEMKIILYQGVLAKGRGLESIIAASQDLHEAGYALVLMGYGPMEDEIAILAQRLPFYLHPAVAPGDLAAYTASADIGLCLIENSCLSYELCLPNKLFEYAMARTPIIASDLPEIRSVLDGSGGGVCISDTTPDGIVTAIRSLDARPDGQLAQDLTAMARRYAWDRQEIQMVAAYQRYILS